MFIIFVNFKEDLAGVERYMQQHQDFIDKYYEAGKFICSGPLETKTGGVILAKAKDRAEVLEIIKDDPFSVHDLSEFVIVEFKPTKCSEQFKPIL